MNVSVTLKSIQFWIKPTAIMQFADFLEKSELPNCIAGTDSGALVVEVDYDPANKEDVRHISGLQKSEIMLHFENVD